ncbi:2,3-bisphosphoglycerate-independent phosphoglycerate mutase-like [Dorcoceras hygrometricum]|nr:2,3-bisphosphoglycerate-independent phosphoglycerate mutase-like [Dorcoceras hygrometricum]
MGSSEFSWKLKDHTSLPKGKTVAMVVLDGWGETQRDQYNCIHLAQTPAMDSLKKNDWNVVKRGWDAQVLGEARHKFKNAVEAVTKLQELPDTNDQNLLGLP